MRTELKTGVKVCGTQCAGATRPMGLVETTERAMTGHYCGVITRYDMEDFYRVLVDGQELIVHQDDIVVVPHAVRQEGTDA